MKRILIAISLLFVVGCSKDDSQRIVGTWALVDYTAINVRTGKVMSSATDVQTWTFYDSGSAYVNGATPLTYYIMGKHLTITYVNSGLEVVYEIEELSETNLKVYWYFVPGKYQDGMDNWYTFIKMK